MIIQGVLRNEISYGYIKENGSEIGGMSTRGTIPGIAPSGIGYGRTATGTMCRLTTTCCESREPFSEPFSKPLSELLRKLGINESFAHLGQVSNMKVKCQWDTDASGGRVVVVP